nr:DNA helicase Pif1-like protein [Tanacetum cinerariifolium]
MKYFNVKPTPSIDIRYIPDVRVRWLFVIDVDDIKLTLLWPVNDFYCLVPLSSAVEQPIAHEPTQFNVCRDSHLEGVPSPVVGSFLCRLKRKTQEDDRFKLLLGKCYPYVKQLVVRMVPSEWDLRRVRSKPRYYQDDHYGCLFQQLGSVETQGQSSGAGGEPFGVASTGFLLTTGDNLDFKPAGMFSSEESPLNRNRLSTPRARNTLLQKFTSATGQRRRSGHVGGISYECTDLGDCDQQCHHCGAAFWFGERLKDHELENMMRHFGGLDNSNLDLEIVQGLIHFLDTYTELVQLFRTMRDRCREAHINEFMIRLYNGNDARGYELPASNTLGAIVFDSGLTCSTEFDVIIKHKGEAPKRITKLHRSYMSSFADNQDFTLSG